MRDGSIELRDRRRLGYAEHGVAGGPPVVYFHPTPGSRFGIFGDAPRRAGVRFVAAERPGYGLSDPRPGRRLLDWAADVEQLADALGLERFAVLGVSGGGPHALACGYALPQRVQAVGLASSPGPYFDEPELSELLHDERRAFVELARRDPQTVEARVREEAPVAAEEILAGGGDPDVQEGLRAGLEGLVGDRLVNYARPWGFRPHDVRVPVLIWHGEADDGHPPAVARWAAGAIPGAALTVYPGEGHLCDLAHAEEILRALAAA